METVLSILGSILALLIFLTIFAIPIGVCATWVSPVGPISGNLRTRRSTRILIRVLNRSGRSFSSKALPGPFWRMSNSDRSKRQVRPLKWAKTLASNSTKR